MFQNIACTIFCEKCFGIHGVGRKVTQAGLKTYCVPQELLCGKNTNASHKFSPNRAKVRGQFKDKRNEQMSENGFRYEQSVFCECSRHGSVHKPVLFPIQGSSLLQFFSRCLLKPFPVVRSVSDGCTHKM